MKYILSFLGIFILTSSCGTIYNSVTNEERDKGWASIFDGKTFDGWRSYNHATVLDGRWQVDDGTIYLDPSKKAVGDIISDKQYQNFDFSMEWKIQECGNSGFFWNVVEDEKYKAVYLTGPEMQILDNKCHPDAKIVTHRAGDLYDMIETSEVTVKPAGEWNHIRVVSLHNKYQFWQNGTKVVEFEMHNEKWKDMVANSKFKTMPDFGLAKKGHLALQDHGDEVWFRNIKIKELQ